MTDETTPVEETDLLDESLFEEEFGNEEDEDFDLDIDADEEEEDDEEGNDEEA